MNALWSDGGPAFPGSSPSTGAGLTVREYIAAQVLGHVAMATLMAETTGPRVRDRESPAYVARVAVELADALMAELRK